MMIAEGSRMREEGSFLVSSVTSDYANGTIAEGTVSRGVVTTGAVGSHSGSRVEVGWIENRDGRQRSALAGERVKMQLKGVSKFGVAKGDELDFTT